MRHAPALLLLKANPWHDPRTGRFTSAPADQGGGSDGVSLPSSASIATPEDARAYWQRHLGGKTLELAVIDPRTGRRLSVSFEFPAGNTHAWTRSAEPGDDIHATDRGGPRTFDAARAQHMDRMLPTLTRPWSVLRSEDGRHLYLGSKIDRQMGYFAVMAMERPGHCVFVTAQPRPLAAMRAMRQALPNATPGLMKAMPPVRTTGGTDRVLHGFQGLCPPEGPAAAAAEAERPAVANEHMGRFLDLLKAASIPPGARWITVRPNGPGTEGTPVLIQPSGDGAFHVVGGAGGKLNYLKLTGVRSEAEYAERAKESAKARKEQRLERAKRDREAGIAGQKQKAIDQLRLTAEQARADFVKTVSEALGWTPEQTAFKPEDHQDKPPGEVEALAKAHFDTVFQTATKAVQAQRQRILADADLRAEGGLTAIPLTAPADPERITVADLAPINDEAETGLGFQPQYEKRAAEAGATPEEMRAEAAEAQPKPAPTEEAQQAKETAKQERADLAAKTAEHLEAIREKTPRPDPKARVAAKQAMAVLRAERELREKLKQVRGRAKEIANADRAEDIAPTAFVIETGAPKLDEEVRRGIEEELRTIRTRGFLAEATKHNAAAVTKHVAAGAFNAVNSLALAAGGSALMDRSVVDVLGAAGAAQALAHRLAADLPAEELAQVRDAMGRYHVEHYMERSRAALDEARQLQEEAAEIELGEAASGADLALAQELNARRRELTRSARATLATALGEMETNAAIVTALEKPTRDRITVPMGELAATDAIVRLRAIGLERGDYTIERAGPNTIAVVKGEAIGKLTQPVAREDIERVNRSLAIMQGLEDQDDWLPEGVARRPDFGRAAPMGVAPRLARPFPASPGDVRQAVRDYIGGRAADGDAPADIMAGLLAEDVIQRAGDREAFMAAVNEVAPLYDAEGRMIRAETHADAFEKLADEFTERAYGTARAPIHKQPLIVDKVSAEALHRAFAQLPEATLGFKPVGDLTTEDQRAIRAFFTREFASADPEAKAKRARVAELDGQEPEKETDGLFGRGENPEWSRWKRERDEAAEAANAADFTWSRYVAAHGGPEGAYQAMQDILRGRAIEAFAKEHNTLRPDKPLRLGRASIRGDLAHLDAVDPTARAKREQERRDLTDRLRNRIAGRYAQGSVIDKMAAAREAEEAATQAQMGLFGEEPAPAEAETLPENTAPLAPGERWTVGHAAERQLAGMTAAQGAMWRPGEPVKLFAPTMSGRFAPRQRAVKLIENNRRVMLGMGVGSGKAQPLHAHILTPTGWTTMGALREGDEVIAGDGTVCRVTGVFPQGRRPIYRLTFTDGAHAECCDEHLWQTWTHKEREYGQPGKVRSLADIRARFEKGYTRGRGFSFPILPDVAFPMRPVPLDAYALGLLLGDGTLRDNSICFSNPEPELCAALAAALPAPVEMRQQGKAGIDYRLTTGTRGHGARNPLLDTLRGLGIAGCRAPEKRVPDIYKFNDRATRLAVLQGLLDTDGCAENAGASITFCTVSPSLRDDVVFLVRSLGGLTRLRSKLPTYTYRGERRAGQEAFTVTISLPPDVPPFRLTRKAARAIPKSKYQPRHRFLDAIEPAGESECICIAVDHPSRLYVTDDMVVTHNTSIMLSAFTHLKARGKANRGLFLVPSVVQGQFGAEANAMLEPGKFKWHANPGAGRSERIGALKDGGHHFVVQTHQAFRDDVLHLAAQHAGTSPEAVADRLSAMTAEQRAEFIHDTLAREGIAFDYLAVDEGHNLLNRKGKANSRMADVADAVSARTPNFVLASADPTKNDVSEAFDTLAKMDPQRYRDRDAFMRRYGVNTEAAREGLRRELARHYYTASVAPGVEARKQAITVPLHAEDQARIAAIQQATGAARLARLEGRVDIAAMRELTPRSFEGVPAEQHEEVARRLQDAIGVVKDSAMRRALSGRGKVDALAKIAGERKGRPGVVFARSLDAVEALAERLKAEGHRVITMTGKHGAKEKDAIKRAFQAGEHDILIASDAGCVGANLQHGKWLAQFDVPQTAMVHAQRNGRIHRIGQTEDVELFDLHADHPEERVARERLSRKYGLRDIVTSPLDGLDDTGLAGMLHRIRAGKEGAAIPPDRRATEAERAEVEAAAPKAPQAELV